MDEVARWAQQVRKGSTRLALLQLLSERERYGYELVNGIRERTRGVLPAAEGNVYPALHALEEEGLVTSVWRATDPGVPPRKYYLLTPAGRALHERLVTEWRSYAGAIDRLLEGE